MRQRHLVSGFSELKNLLIQKYDIKEDRMKLRLHFTMRDGELFVHNYKLHHQQIQLTEMLYGKPENKMQRNSRARRVIYWTLKEK